MKNIVILSKENGIFKVNNVTYIARLLDDAKFFKLTGKTKNAFFAEPKKEAPKRVDKKRTKK